MSTDTAMKSKSDNIRALLVGIVIAVALSVAVWLIVPVLVGSFAPSGSDLSHPAGEAFVSHGSFPSAVTAPLMIGMAFLVFLVPEIITVRRISGSDNGRAVFTVITLVSGIAAAFALICTSISSFSVSDDIAQANEEAFVEWADIRYGVDLSSIDGDSLDHLYESGTGTAEVRDPDTGESITSYTDDTGTILIVGADTDAARELPVKAKGRR